MTCIFFRKLIVKVLKNNGMFDVGKILVCDNGNKNGNLPFCCYGFQTSFDLRSFQLPSFLFLLSFFFFFFFFLFFPQNLYIYICLSFHFHLITFVLALNANVSKTSVSLSVSFFRVIMSLVITERIFCQNVFRNVVWSE